MSIWQKQEGQEGIVSGSETTRSDLKWETVVNIVSEGFRGDNIQPGVGRMCARWLLYVWCKREERNGCNTKYSDGSFSSSSFFPFFWCASICQQAQKAAAITFTAVMVVGEAG